ncbi:MAG: tripartite tricarboxylate transporter substrate binding protein [Pseudomonadota bacterium]
MQRRQLIKTAGTALAAGWVHTQGWSAQSIRYIVPFPPGGATDAISRVLTEHLRQRMGQPVMIENIPGAGGLIGTARLKQSAPDGYTIGLGNSATHTIAPQLVKSVPYDPLADFTAISMLTEYANVLVVAATSSMKTMKDFVTLGRSKPEGFSYGSAGNGSSNHLSAALLASKAGLQMTHVPYKGNGAALTDMLGGRIDWMFAGLSEVLPFVQDKRLRIIGISSRTTDPMLPDVPPIGETVPGFEMAGFMGVFAPANFPAPMATRFAQEVQAILRLPEVAKGFEVQGLRVKSSTPEELAARVRRDYAMWKAVIASAGIKAE